MSSVVRDNTDRHRYELERDGHLAFANYERRGSELVIRHVEAAVPLRGTGAAGELMRGVAEIARSAEVETRGARVQIRLTVSSSKIAALLTLGRAFLKPAEGGTDRPQP